ncbi:MAG: PKD domain-containing protein [Candidatus Thermoplasmatota archaeon]
MVKKKLIAGLVASLIVFSLVSSVAGELEQSSKEFFRADAGDAQIVAVNETVNFSGSASGGVEPYNYSWNFNRFYIGFEGFSWGMDTTIDAYGDNVTWVYNSSGLYIVKLEVRDNQSNIAEDYTAVIVLSEEWISNYHNFTTQCEHYNMSYQDWLDKFEELKYHYEDCLANYSLVESLYNYLVNLSANWSFYYQKLLETIYEIKQNCSYLQNLTFEDYFDNVTGCWNLSDYNETFSQLCENWEENVNILRNATETLKNYTFGFEDWQSWKDNFTFNCSIWLNICMDLNFTINNLSVEYEQNNTWYMNLTASYANWNTACGSWIEKLYSIGGFTKKWRTNYNWSCGFELINTSHKDWQSYYQKLYEIDLSHLYEKLSSLNTTIQAANLSANYTHWLQIIINLTQELRDIMIAQNWTGEWKKWLERYKEWEENATAVQEKLEKVREHYQNIRNYISNWSTENITTCKHNISLYIENFAGYAANWTAYYSNLTDYYGNFSLELNISMELTIVGDKINISKEFGFVLIAGYNNTSASVWITHEMSVEVIKQFSVDKKLVVKVSGGAQDANKTLRIVIPANAINISRLEILFDNVPLAKEYINWTVDGELLIILIKVPHFSEHIITVQEALVEVPPTAPPIIPDHYKPLAILLAIIVIIVAAVYLYNFRKKKAL